MSEIRKNLGGVTAYAYAKSKGYTGTEDEFAQLMANYATVGQAAEEAAEQAISAEINAESAAQTATTKASEASSSATSASSSASAAATSETNAAASATSASGSATQAATSASAAQAAQAAAEEVAESIPEDYSELSADVDDLKNAVTPNTQFIEPFHVNIADPNTETVHLYFNGTQFSVAAFIYMLPIKVKPNTVYTVMQKATASNDFHVGTSAAYPVSGGACSAAVTTNPSIIKTGANDNYINVIYYNERRDASPIAPNTIMVVEGVVDNFVERNVAKNKLPEHTVSLSGCVIADEFVKDTEVRITSSESTGIVVSNENLIIPSYYETLTSKTTGGITFTVNADLSIIANGTATGNADFYFMKSSAPKIFRNAREPLYFRCCPEINSGYFAYINGADRTDEGNGSIVSNPWSITSGFIRILSGATVDNVVFKPMLSRGSERKNFVTPKGNYFSGVTDITVIATGETMSFSTTTAPITVVGNRAEAKVTKLLIDDETRRIHVAEYKKPYIISSGHRGLLTEAPENTIFSFRAAVEAGVDYLESDIQFTSDGVPVMFHDTTIDRVVNGHTGAIADYTWAEVQEFDVYTYFQNQYPAKWKDEFEDARILSLEQYIKMAKGFGIKSTLEIKVAGANNRKIAENMETLKSLIKQYNYENDILWNGSLTSVYHALYLLMDNQELPFLLILERVPTSDDIAILEMFNTGKNAIGITTTAYNSLSNEIYEKYVIGGYLVNTTQEAIAINPHVDTVCSNSICVKDVRKQYYMENLVT